ncbi:MAG TPA: SDR family oxidoreductase [Thermoleophilaceae bacterium]|nr:SDR family oxidoreductase [Thermoleophilaceae bacterium]
MEDGLQPESRGAAPGRARLEGRRILVVGGGQQTHGLEDPPIGNGRAMSVLFAREGAGVAVADLDSAAAAATVELVDREGTAAVALEADAADEASVVRMIDAARESLGGLDGIVLNVGIGAGFGVQGTSVEDWDHVLAVNLRSHFLGCKHGLPALAHGGAIVLIGSLAGLEYMPIPAYGASKAALESLTRSAAVEGAPRVRVNLVVPGLIDTSLGRLATQLAPDRGKVRIPLGREGTAWEVAFAALYLLSSEAAYVTGQSLVVDGGLSQAPRS